MLYEYEGIMPTVGERCFIADSAAVIGPVTLAEDCSVWFGASLRGDCGPIEIGARSNVQDNATVHNSTDGVTKIGADVSIGHNAVVHNAVIEDGVLIGMGAVVLDNAVVGEGSTVAAGAVVTKGTIIPPNSLVIGVPAKVVRTMQPGSNIANSRNYVKIKDNYLKK